MADREGVLSAFVGAVLGSSVITAIIGLLPTYFPPARTFEWSKAPSGPGDCAAADTMASYTSQKPTKENCTSEDDGTIAVCWDGQEYKNPGNPKNDANLAWCTYFYCVTTILDKAVAVARLGNRGSG